MYKINKFYIDSNLYKKIVVKSIILSRRFFLMSIMLLIQLLLIYVVYNWSNPILMFNRMLVVLQCIIFILSLVFLIIIILSMCKLNFKEDNIVIYDDKVVIYRNESVNNNSIKLVEHTIYKRDVLSSKYSNLIKCYRVKADCIISINKKERVSINNINTIYCYYTDGFKEKFDEWLK